jgi:hypothetical protein
MKNIFFLLLSCTLLSPLNAQPWSIGARWVYDQDEFFPTPETRYLVLTNIGDTLLQGRTCSVLEETSVRVLLNGSVEKYTGTKHMLWTEGLRTEVFDPFAQTFFPLYDLDKKAGDSLDSYCIFAGQTMRLAVDSVTVTNEGSQPLKTLWAHSVEPGNCYLYGPIVERLGWKPYFFPRPGFVDPPPGGALRCFTDDSLLFPADTDCPDFLVGENEPPFSKAPVLWPNPVRNGVVHWDAEGVFEVRVFDAQGRLAKSVENPGRSFHIADCPQGLLLIELRTKNQVIVKKVWNQL